MAMLLIVAATVAILFGWAVCSAWNASRRGRSEERAHASAARRRHRLAGSRSARSAASIMILGESHSRAECRITHLSKRQIRICGPDGLKTGAQVLIEYGGDEFVGDVMQSQPTHGGLLTDIAIRSTTHSGSGILARFTRAFQG